MSVTYPTEPTKPYSDRVKTPAADISHNEPFVPVYARRGKARGGQGKIRTWMILTPVAVVVLGGIGAMMVMNGGEDPVPLAEPAETAPVLSAAPVTATAVAPLTAASAPAPVVATPPVVREAAPLRPAAPAPARRETVRAPAATPAAPPRAVTPVPAGPQPYTVAPSVPPTSTLNTTPPAPATTPVPTPPPPIIIDPLG